MGRGQDGEEEVNYRQAIEHMELIHVVEGLLVVHGPFCQKISYHLENDVSPHGKTLGGENNWVQVELGMRIGKQTLYEWNCYVNAVVLMNSSATWALTPGAQA